MNKSPEKTGKTRFNVIDVIIIVAVVAVIAAIIFIAINKSGSEEQSNAVKVHYTVRFEQVPEGALAYIKSGENIKNAAKDSIGEVSAVRSERSKYYGKDALTETEDGYEMAVSEYPDRYDVYVTVISAAELDDAGIPIVEGAKILIGTHMENVSISSFAGSGYVVAFEITDRP